MAARTKLKVIWENGGWQVVQDGKILKIYVSQSVAEKYARRLAGKMISGQVLIYRMNGSILKSFFYVNPPRLRLEVSP